MLPLYVLQYTDIATKSEVQSTQGPNALHWETLSQLQEWEISLTVRSAQLRRKRKRDET